MSLALAAIGVLIVMISRPVPGGDPFDGILELCRITGVVMVGLGFVGHGVSVFRIKPSQQDKPPENKPQ